MNYLLASAFLGMAIVMLLKAGVDYKLRKAYFKEGFPKSSKALKQVIWVDFLAAAAWMATAILTYLKK